MAFGKSLSIFFVLLTIHSVYSSLFICDPHSLLHRSFDGSCNNLFSTQRGSVGTFFKTGNEGREAYPGIHDAPPQTTPTYENISELPSDGPRGNARTISNEFAVRTDESAIDTNGHNMFSTMIGQFINHDLENTRTKNSNQLGGANLKTFMLSQDDAGCYKNPQVPIGSRDYFCLNNDTVLAVGIKSSVGVIDNEDLIKVYNDATSFFDLDHVYGRTEDINKLLRKGDSGKMLVTESVDVSFPSVVPGMPPVTMTLKNLLPFKEDANVPVDPLYGILGLPKSVFVAGDERLNQNMALTFFHTLFVREHNKICDELIADSSLFRLFPTLMDDIIFRKARKLTIAKWQHILYEQYLPSVYGTYFSHKIDSHTNYKPQTDPSTLTVFAGVAFRYGHYTPKSYYALNECGQSIVNNMVVPMKQPFVGFQNPTPIALSAIGRMADSGGIENVARGLIEQPVQENYFTVEEILRNFPALAGSFDLATIDIMRARYNNIPNYLEVRRAYFADDDPLKNDIYGLNDCPVHLESNLDVEDPIECFLHITSDVERAEKLKSLYGKINNIDAIVGVQSEDHVPGTSFGKTAGHIVVDQFRRSRDGDRFFYRNLPQWLSFSVEERQEIVGTTMGKLLRRNLKDSVFEFPDNPFVVPENYRDNLFNTC